MLEIEESILNILNQSQNGIVITDPNQKENPILFANNQFCEKFEYKKEQFIGKNCSFLQADDKDQPAVKEIKNAIKNQKAVTQTLRNYTKSGELVYNEISISPIFDKEKKIKYFLGIQKDVTKERLLQKENQKLLEDRLETAQLNAIGRLSGGISHEINTPLTVINGTIEMLKESIHKVENPKLKSNILEDIEDMELNLNRIKNIAESMREIADTHKFEMKETNLYRALIFSLRLTHHKSKNITKIYIQNEPFTIDLERDKLKFSIQADQIKLEQAFMAIIDNALDELEFRGSYEKNRLDVKIIEDRDSYKLIFQDNAGGIEPKLLEDIFKPFKSEKQHRGLGIGLSVVKKIIDQHNFDIEFENANGGAKITITMKRQDI